MVLLHNQVQIISAIELGVTAVVINLDDCLCIVGVAISNAVVVLVERKVHIPHLLYFGSSVIFELTDRAGKRF